MSRRVVITGVGTVNALANTAPATWARMLEGESGIARITHFDPAEFACQIAGEIKELDTSHVVEARELKKLDPFTLYGMTAAHEAVADSGIKVSGFDPDRAGCIMGVGIGGLTDMEATKITLLERGPRRVSPYYIPKIMMNAVAGRVSMQHGLRGPNFVTASACASSA